MDSFKNKFDHELFGSLTVIHHKDHGDLFIGREVHSKLGFRSSDLARNLKRHCKSLILLNSAEMAELKIEGSPRGLNCIREIDVYRLILKSRLPEAEKFEEWVVGTILPTLRKGGFYLTGQEDMSEGEVKERISRAVDGYSAGRGKVGGHALRDILEMDNGDADKIVHHLNEIVRRMPINSGSGVRWRFWNLAKRQVKRIQREYRTNADAFDVIVYMGYEKVLHHCECRKHALMHGLATRRS